MGRIEKNITGTYTVYHDDGTQETFSKAVVGGGWVGTKGSRIEKNVLAEGFTVRRPNGAYETWTKDVFGDGWSSNKGSTVKPNVIGGGATYADRRHGTSLDGEGLLEMLFGLALGGISLAIGAGLSLGQMWSANLLQGPLITFVVGSILGLVVRIVLNDDVGYYCANALHTVAYLMAYGSIWNVKAEGFFFGIIVFAIIGLLQPPITTPLSIGLRPFGDRGGLCLLGYAILWVVLSWDSITAHKPGTVAWVTVIVVCVVSAGFLLREIVKRSTREPANEGVPHDVGQTTQNHERQKAVRSNTSSSEQDVELHRKRKKYLKYACLAFSLFCFVMNVHSCAHATSSASISVAFGFFVAMFVSLAAFFCL